MTYTTHKYVVATKKQGRTFDLYYACDDYSEAKKQFNQKQSCCEQVRIYTRRQWNGPRSHYRMHKNITVNNCPIPSSVGMMLINQADSSCF